MRLAQSGTNLTEITGTLGSFEEAITGVVTADGRLTLGGTFREWDWEHEIVERLADPRVGFEPRRTRCHDRSLVRAFDFLLPHRHRRYRQ
jgi:hypothetical protein